MKYQIKTEQVEAIQYFDDLHQRYASIPAWLNLMVADKFLTYENKTNYVKTPMGKVIVFNSDWIIKHAPGWFEVMTDKLFKDKYVEIK